MSNVHLLVLLHGMWGHPSHLAELARVVKEKKGDQIVDDAKLEILVSQTNQEESTYDGVDWGGERVAEEVILKIKALEKEGRRVTKFSVVGYSLGGLIGRYVIGILYQKQLFDHMKPINFITIASPHIGLVRYRTFFSTLSSKLGPSMMSRTGEQFFNIDRWSTDGRSLLEVMADPDHIFYRALSLFPHIRIYANAVNDMTVPYPTAAIEASDPFADMKGIEVVMDPEYEPVIQSYRLYDSQHSSHSKPKQSFATRLRRLSPNNVLPPELQFPFPFNLVSYTLLPVIWPTLVILVISRLGLSARSSRARVKLLEKDGATRRTELYNVVARLEREVESIALDAADAITSSEPSTATIVRPAQEDSLPDETSPAPTNDTKFHPPQSDSQSKDASSSSGPIFTSRQLQMIDSLNALPNLQKYIAYMEHIKRSHATIVCRDVNGYPYHKYGEGVLRHLADAFVL